MTEDFHYLQSSAPIEYPFSKSELEGTEGYWRAVKKRYGIATKEVGFKGLAADSTRYVGPELCQIPRNIFVTTPFFTRLSYDIRWDHSPSLYCIGYSIYRSFRELGEYTRLNTLIMNTNWYRDITTDRYIQYEDLSDQLPLVLQPNLEYSVFTKYPIMRESSMGVMSDSSEDVKLYINNEEVIPLAVIGKRGEVWIRKLPYYDAQRNSAIEPVIPQPGNSFRISYWANVNSVEMNFDFPYYYKVTSIQYDPATGELIETNPSLIPAHYLNPEPMDWIWKEAVRRNSWIAEIAGERMLLFQRKMKGIPCECWQRSGLYTDFPKADCLACWGTGIIGGYESPYPIIVVIPFADKVISSTDLGRTVTFDADYWMSPFPRVEQYDVLLRQDGTMLKVGGVARPNHRGNIALQQHFPASRIPRTHLLYKLQDASMLDVYRPLYEETETLPPANVETGETVHVLRAKEPVPPGDFKGLSSRFPTVVY